MWETEIEEIPDRSDVDLGKQRESSADSPVWRKKKKKENNLMMKTLNFMSLL